MLLAVFMWCWQAVLSVSSYGCLGYTLYTKVLFSSFESSLFLFSFCGWSWFLNMNAGTASDDLEKREVVVVVVKEEEVRFL